MSKSPQKAIYVQKPNGEMAGSQSLAGSEGAVSVPTKAATVPAGVEGVEASGLSRFVHLLPASGQAEGVEVDVEELSVQIDELAEQVATLKAAEADQVFRVGDLGVEDTHLWGEDDEISRVEAIDLVRLNRAKARELRTQALVAAEEAEGTQLLKPYGGGLLGTAEATGTYVPNTRDWLLARAQGIGGSDKIGYLDEDNRFVPYTVSKVEKMLSSKTPQAIEEIRRTAPVEPPAEDQADDSPLPIKIGNALERTIQHEFAVAHPEYSHFEDKSSRIAAGRPWHRFNPDGVLQDAGTGAFGVFEAKTSRDLATYEQALPGYKAQCLHNAAAAGLNFAVLVADVEGEARQQVVRLDFTDAQLAAYRRTLDAVWLHAKPTYDRSRLGRFR